MSLFTTACPRHCGILAALALLHGWLATFQTAVAQEEPFPGFSSTGIVLESYLNSPPFLDFGNLEQRVWERPVPSPVQNTQSLWLRFRFDQAGDRPWSMEIKDERGEVVMRIPQETVAEKTLPSHIWTPEIQGSRATIELYGNAHGLAFSIDRVAVQELLPTPASVAEEPPKLVWNLWAAATDGSPFRPQPTLQPNGTPYQIMLHLSWFEYGNEQYGVRSWKGDPELRRAVAEWLNKDPTRPTVELQAFLLFDATYFETPSNRIAPLKIDLQKIRAFWKGGATRPDDAFAIMAAERDKGGEPNFVFGSVDFTVKTSGEKGWAAIGIVLFYRERPIDEITTWLCIGTCEGRPQLPASLRGLDSLAVATEASPLPDASLYFLELVTGYTYGVFRRNDVSGDTSTVGNYQVWSLRRSPGDFVSYLEKTLIPAMGHARDQQSLLNHGEDLFALLFPPHISEARTAAAAFQAFTRAHTQQPRQPTAGEPPSIFVRVVTQLPDPPPLIPLGLMVVETGEGPKDFLGLHFRIEAPLERQTYEPRQECLSRWVTVLPPETIGEPLKSARRQMGKTYDDWQKNSAVRSFDSMRHFAAWIKDGSVEEGPTALLVLSHHTRNTLSYVPGDEVLSTSVQRRFQKPSIAILNGCGTAEPGAVDLIRHLNLAGIETVIATSTEVDGEMAGDFYRCLDDQLKQHIGNDRYAIANAYFDTLQCLRSRKPGGANAQQYGAAVLRYTLIGNAHARLCPPLGRR